MYDVQLCTYVVHARYIPVTSDLRMRNRHVEVAYCQVMYLSRDVYLCCMWKGQNFHTG